MTFFNATVVESATFTELSEIVAKPLLDTSPDGVPRPRLAAVRQCIGGNIDVYVDLGDAIGLSQGRIVFDALLESLENTLQVLTIAFERLDQRMFDCERFAVRSSDERINGTISLAIEPADGRTFPSGFCVC